MNKRSLFVLLTCFSSLTFSSLFAQGNARAFYSQYVIIPDERGVRDSFSGLLDPNEQFIRTARPYYIPASALPALTTHQLRVLFFVVPSNYLLSQEARPLAMARQAKAAELFVQLPVYRIARLLTHPNLRLVANLSSEYGSVNLSELMVAKVYALQLLRLNETKFLEVLLHIMGDPFQENPVGKAIELLQLIRSDLLVRQHGGVGLHQVIRLVEKLKVEKEWKGLAKRLLLQNLRSEQPGSSEAEVSYEDIEGFRREVLDVVLTPEGSKKSTLKSVKFREGGRAISRLTEGEYIVVENSGLKSSVIQILPATSSTVVLVLQSDKYSIAMMIDPDVDIQDTISRIFARMKLIKVEYSGMVASVFGGSPGPSDQIIFEIKRIMPAFGIKVNEQKSEYLVDRESNRLILGKELALIEGHSPRMPSLYRAPDQQKVLLRPDPESLDYGDLIGEAKIPVPSGNESFKKADKTNDGRIGKEDLVLLELHQIKSLFNPPADSLEKSLEEGGFPEDDAASLLLNLPFWMAAEIFSQAFAEKSQRLLTTYIRTLLNYDEIKLQQIVLYMAPPAKSFRYLSRNKNLQQIFSAMTEEEKEGFLRQLDASANNAFQDYVEALQDEFLPKDLADGLDLEDEPVKIIVADGVDSGAEGFIEETETEGAVTVEALEGGDLTPAEEDTLEVAKIDRSSLQSAADYSYIPGIYPGSWKRSLQPLSEKQSPHWKAMLEPDSVVVSVFDPTKNLMAAFHVKSSAPRMSTHRLIEEFLDDLHGNPGFDLEMSDVSILVGNQRSVRAMGSSTTLDRIQKRFLLNGFRSVQTRDLGVTENEAMGSADNTEHGLRKRAFTFLSRFGNPSFLGPFVARVSRRQPSGELRSISAEAILIMSDLRELRHLRTAKLLELPQARRFQKEPGLSAKSIRSMSGSRESSESFYKNSVRGRCEYWIAGLARRGSAVKKKAFESSTY